MRARRARDGRTKEGRRAGGQEGRRAIDDVQQK